MRTLVHYLKRTSLIAGKGGIRLIPAVVVIVWTVSLPNRRVWADIDAAMVQRSIDRGIAYLRKTQTERGRWNEFPNQSCGLTSLCTLALLNAGVAHDDPIITRAMRYLRGISPRETYSASLQTLVFCQMGAAGDLPMIRRNVDLLTAIQKTAGMSRDPNRIGSWGYGGQRPSSGDPSNTQFALLALGAAKDRGIEVDEAVFERSLEYWTRRQRRSGGWSYSSQQGPTGSMTCAGIASLIIARGRIEKGKARIVSDRIVCCGGAETAKDPVELGLQWLGQNLSLELNPGGQAFTYFYYLYALERVGRLSGRRFIGDHDWYREGAETLLELQDQFEGFWAGSGWEQDRNIGTAFALLFLSKGKRQVVVGRLSHGQQADNPTASWNRHPDSLRQLVRHVEQAWGRDLTWQTIESERASVEDLMQTPVLVISGRDNLNFSKELAERLDEYIQQGGTILFEADGGDGCGDARQFARSTQSLCGTWFPGAKLERLPPSHPVWFAEGKVDPNRIDLIGSDFWVYGVQACCRTAVFFVPRSLSCRWALGDVLFRRGDRSSKPREQIELSVRLGQNIIAYATGRELKDKLDARVVLDGSELPETTRGVIQLAMLSIDAGGDEAQRALPNVAAIIRQSRPMLIAASPDPVGFDPDQLQHVPVLWIHGRTDFKFTDTQRQALRDFVSSQGIIFATAICGSPAFADAFRREIADVLPEAPLKTVPPSHPMLGKHYGGFDIKNVTIRNPIDSGRSVTLSKRSGPPQLEIATLEGIDSVFFSPLDVSCALESQNSVQCPGYETADAAKIVTNVLLYALQH